MDTTVNNSVPVASLGKQQQVALPLKRTSAQSAPFPAPVKAEGAFDQTLENAEVKRLDRIRQAANTFAVSDQSFTIYKDTSGQYITRFTSLRDGKVTYVPEPNILAALGQFQSAAGTNNLSLKI